MPHKSDLELAFEMLRAKAEPYTELWAYYDGAQKLKYSSTRLEKVFKHLDTRFIQNWAAPVVDAALERINLKMFDVNGNDELSDRLNQLWSDTEMTLDSEDAHAAALVVGEAFIIVWKDEDSPTQVFYNDPRLCHVFYEAENPRVKRFAVKWWVGDDERVYLTLYYPDRFEYYVSPTKEPTQVAAFVPLDIETNEPVEIINVNQESMAHIAPNPWGTIPIFHLRRERRKIKSELANVIPLQDSINKLLSDMMVSAEFAAFRQRYVISNVDMEGQLKSAPGEIWDLPGAMEGMQDTEVGELGSTELGNYLQAIEQLSMSIGVITRTPKHYFFQSSTSNISGDALIALESPLNKKVETYIKRFQVTWQNVAEFVLRLEGHAVDSTSITAVFDAPQTIQPMVQAQMRETNVRTGMPLKFLLRQEGFTEAQLDELDKERAEEESQRETLGSMLLRDFETGQEGAIQ